MKLFSENFFPKSNELIKRLKFFRQNLKVAAICAENGKFFLFLLPRKESNILRREEWKPTKKNSYNNFKSMKR